MKIQDIIPSWLKLDGKGELEMDRSSQALFLKTLAGRDCSFAVIAIRCNSKNSTGKRKMDAGRMYYLLQGYTIGQGYVEVENWREAQNRLYDDFYTELTDGKPHLQISAIVGQNGAGKSSVIEFMMRLINNFAASTIGERQLGEAAERLHYIDKVDGEMWYMLRGRPHHLKVRNGLTQLTWFKDVDEYREHKKTVYRNEMQLFGNEGDEKSQKVTEVMEKMDDKELKALYEHFFYTMISNQSIYAYNTRDFYLECNDDEKENKALGEEDRAYSDEDRCWLHGIFHKNDGYKTPMVVTPYRYEGNSDINKENLFGEIGDATG